VPILPAAPLRIAMKKLLPLAVVLVLALAGGLAWFLFAGEPARTATATGASAQAQPAPEAKTDLPEAPAPELVAPEVAADEPAAETRREADEDAFDPALALQVRGTVDLPLALPADERLRIVAYTRGDADILSGGAGPARAPDDFGDALAVTDVDPDGTWVIGVPRDRAVVLVLRGRYLRSATRPTVEDGEAPAAPHFPTELGAWITGRLVLPEGAAIRAEELEDLRVQWRPGSMSDFTRMGGAARVAREQREAKLSLALEFEFTGVGAIEGDVRVAPESFAAVKSARLTPRPGEHLVLDLPLVEGGTLAGRVLDDAGGPVAGARLEVTVDPLMLGQGGFEVREGETDDEGRFTLAHVATGELIVAAEADGHLDARTELELGPGEARSDLELVLDLGNAIAGHVRWPDGAPAVEVQVVAEFDMANLGGMGAFNAMRGPRGKAKTDADGAFRVSGLGKGPFTVRAEAQREGATWSVSRDAVAPETLDVELVLEETLAIAGRVVDDRGEPLSNFRVRAQEKTGGMIPGMGGARRSERFEDEDGAFRLEGLSERTWMVRAEAEGHGQAEPLEVALAGAPKEDLLLTLPRAASVRGVVVAPDGRPVGGAEVTLKFELMDMARLANLGESPSAVSEPDGSFLLEGLTPGTLKLVAAAEGFADSTALPLEVAPAQTLEGMALTLRIGGRILGEIYGKGGERQAGAPILAQNPANFSGQKWVTSDANGEFVIDNLVPGTWQVMTMPGRGALEDVDAGDGEADMSRLFSEMKFQMAEVVEGQDAHVVLGGRPADPVSVSGRVLAGGVPQAGALVNFVADSQDASGGMGAFKLTTTAKDGSYGLELDRPGGYMVQVQKLVGSTGQQQSVQLHYELPDEREQTLDLELPVGAITGTVYGPDGQPLGGARVSLTKEGGVSNLTFGGGQYAEIATRPDGTYELVWLREGKYTVSAGGPTMGGLFGGGEDSPARAVRSGVRVADGDHVEGIDFRLKAPGRLVGTVVDGAGKPVGEAAVFVRDEQGNLLERISLAASDAAGRFTYSGIGAGRYLVHARSQSAVSAEVSVVVREGEDSELALTLSPGAILLITLADEDGEPVDCSVTVTDEDGRQVNGNWSMADLMSMFQSGAFTSKEQRVGPVPPGRYTVHAETSAGLSATRRVTIRDQDERRVNLRLKE